MIWRYFFADSAFEQYPFFMQFLDACESKEIPSVFGLSESAILWLLLVFYFQVGKQNDFSCNTEENRHNTAVIH